MAIVYDLGNAANWNLIADITKVAPPVRVSIEEPYFPIADFEAPVQLSSPIFAVYIESESDPGRWRRGGFVKQKIRTGIVGGGQNDSYLTVKPMFLRQINTFTFPPVSTTYSLEFSIPYWLRQISIQVYEYNGLIADTVEQQLDELQAFIMECCDDIKLAIASQDAELTYQDILSRLQQLQQKLDECCNNLPGETGIQQEENFGAANFTNLI